MTARSIDNCSGKLLKSLETCLVNVTLSPLMPGDKSFQLSIGGFSNSEVPLTPILTTSFTGVQSSVVAAVDLEVPAQQTAYDTYGYRFKFINTSNAVVTDPVVTVSATNGTQEITTDLCSNRRLAVGGSCTVTGTYTPSTNGTVTATLNYTGGSATATSNGGGRLIGYLEGWNTPPSAASISAAGYTHVIVAFGVFSTTNPGEIVPTMSGITDPAGYIKSLQNLGIKVLLSIGGASSNVPNTTVDFDQVLNAASSPATFVTSVQASLDNLVATYGFDGFDFDIEQGLIPAGTLSQPAGDIQALSLIINNYYTNHSAILLTLAPQIANISATQAFNQTFGNYSFLIMETYTSLSWVGIQLYNSGCAFGIDCNCWDPNTLTTTPDPAVAFAVDLLAAWPTTCPLGQPSGYQSYTGPLTASQVVLGYPVKNGSGVSDGAPSAVLSVVKSAVECLRTGQGCDTYTIQSPYYPTLGGVFSWDINYDSTNQYQFATGIYPCIVTGTCT